jgi:hypothetical protein
MLGNHLFRGKGWILQAGFDFLQRKTQFFQRENLLKAHHVIGCVYPVSGFRVHGRFQKIDLVVIMKGSYRESGLLGQLPNFPICGTRHTSLLSVASAYNLT